MLDNLTWEDKFKKEKIYLQDLAGQHDWLTAHLNSAEHREKTPTTFYGLGDPRKLDIMPCICGNIDPQVSTNTSEIKTYRISCSCGKNTPPLSTARKAIIFWNLSPHSEDIDYKSLPYFGLSNIDVQTAKIRMKNILEDLKLKIALAIIIRKLNKTTTSRGYEERLTAYRDQAEYSIAVLNRTPITEDNSPPKIDIVRSSKNRLMA